MKNKFLFIFALLFTFYSGFSQTENDSIVYTVKGEYIEKYTNRITGELFYTNTFNSYVFKDRDSDLTIDAEPNKQDRIGGSVAFSFLNLSYSFAPDFLAENRDNADSRLFNLNLKLFLGKWVQSIDVYSEKGFFLESDQIGSGYFEKIKSFKIGGNTSYIFNDNFSYKSVINQTEKQLKSAGSFIPGITYYYSKFSLRDDIIAVDEDLFLFDIALTPSYHYNFVLADDFLLSAGANVGIGLNYSEYEDEKLTSLLTEWSVTATATYDIDNLYLGGHFRYLVLNHNTDRSTRTVDNIPYLQLFVGYRFNAPKKWVRKIEEIENNVIKK